MMNSPNSDTYGTSLRTSHSDEEVLLACSRPKKRAGRKKFKETRHPVYRGVRFRNSNWVCELREPTKQKRIWLGTYPTPEMAARAHDVAALALRGQTACLNFSDSVWRLPVPASIEPDDLRRAAAEAAEAFRPVMYGGDEGQMIENVVEAEDKNLVTSDFDVPDSNYMADGVLMSPPPSLEVSYCWDYVESDAEVELWSYSV